MINYQVHKNKIERSELDNCDVKAFSIHTLWLLSGGGGVSGRHRKGILTAHNWWSVEYETAASGTTQQYKGGKCDGLGSRGLS